MGKVITSAGLNEFVQNGTITNVPDHKPGKNEAPALEVKKEAPVLEVGEKPAEVDKSLEKAIETDEAVPTLSEDSRKYVNKQHRLRKEAQEEAELSERLAREQFNRATLAEQKNQALESELSELKKPKEQPKVETLKFPHAKDFVKDGIYDEEAHEKALDKYNQSRVNELFEQKRLEQYRAQLIDRLKASADVARKAHSDFDEVMSQANGTTADMVPQFVLDHINESDIAGELSYFLLKNPEESQRIARLSPTRGIAELGKLEVKLTTVEAPKVPVPVTQERPGAPPPITPIITSGAGTVNTDPSRMSFAELRAYEREKLRKK